jgi:oxygen-independent coproporphyrinogen-3 oxidase
VPYWDVDKFSLDQWLQAVKRSFDETNDAKGISLYLHLPFCESLCTYCACNTRITKNHRVEGAYIKSLLTEWDLYKKVFGKTPVIREMHLGGGTPTFFSPENLKKLLEPILQDAFFHRDHEFSFEGHPNNTTYEHLQTLYSLGFRRVSYGVQDLDPKVQEAIHRIQPLENLERVTRQSREIGYNSVSFDLIYGLPYQTLQSVENTIEKIISLRPDRIAFYSYAHVPWLKPGQRGYEDADLPSDVLKRSLYETGRRLLKEAGYIDIGMDHFALSADSLAVAHRHRTLHRNFMGYTTTETDLLIGLGTSAISDAKYAYAQGHIQTEEDQFMKRCILDIACKGSLNKTLDQVLNQQQLESLDSLKNNGLITLSEAGLSLTETGRIFIRNICSVFDLRMQSQKQGIEKVFSKAI